MNGCSTNPAMPEAGRLLAFLLMLVMLLFPAIIYFGLERLGPRGLGLALAAACLARLAFLVKGKALHAGRSLGIGAALAGAVLASGAWVFGDAGLLLFYPVLVNGMLFVIFAVSLLKPPTIVERLARLREPDLPEMAVAYTRGVTKLWCGFFVLNGSIALATAIRADIEIWTLYNGLVAYLLMGALFGAELLVRRKMQGRAAA